MHSGGASAAINHGVSERLIGKHGRWKSGFCRDRYLKDGKKQRLQVTQNIGLWNTISNVLIFSVASTFQPQCDSLVYWTPFAILPIYLYSITTLPGSGALLHRSNSNLAPGICRFGSYIRKRPRLRDKFMRAHFIWDQEPACMSVSSLSAASQSVSPSDQLRSNVGLDRKRKLRRLWKRRRNFRFLTFP